jgi:transposase-like protein
MSYRIIEVEEKFNIETKEEKYGNSFRKKWYINDEKISIRKDKIKFKCKKCGKESIRTCQYFCHDEKLLCSSCLYETTIFSKYGVDHPSKDEKIKELKIKKIRMTMNEKYGKWNNNVEKIKETNLKIYGVENAYQIEEVKNKAKQKRSSKDIQEKIEKTNMIKYGYTNALSKGSPGYNKKNNTVKEKYGVNNVFQVKEIQDKCLKNTLSSMRLKKFKTKHGNIIHYQTNPELDFIKTCENLGVRIYDGPQIDYFYNNSNHKYLIDFETDKYLIEIKSSHIWYKNNLKNGKIDSKIKSAELYAESIGKQYLFLLDKTREDLLSIVGGMLSVTEL